MRVPYEINDAEGHEHALIDIEPQMIAALDCVMHVDFGVTLFAVKHFQKEGDVIGARRG